MKVVTTNGTGENKTIKRWYLQSSEQVVGLPGHGAGTDTDEKRSVNKKVEKFHPAEVAPLWSALHYNRRAHCIADILSLIF